MKKIYSVIFALMLAVSLCACSFGSNNQASEPNTTERPETTAPTSMPTMPTVESNVPETTESRGSTDDKEDETNETIEEDIGQKMRRRIMK